MKLTVSQRSDAGMRNKAGRMRSDARFSVAMDPRPDGRAMAKRLQSMGYQPHRHLGHSDGWHAFETQRGIVAITRHPGGRWEVRRKEG